MDAYNEYLISCKDNVIIKFQRIAHNNVYIFRRGGCWCSIYSIKSKRNTHNPETKYNMQHTGESFGRCGWALIELSYYGSTRVRRKARLEAGRWDGQDEKVEEGWR